MAGGGKNKLEYVKQQEPKFLREFKSRTNFKEGPTIETKKLKTEVKSTEKDVDEEDREDEKPVVCVLKDGDLTEEEYEQYRKSDREQDGNDALLSEGKIVFKKPTKRTNEDSFKDSSASSRKKVKEKETKTSKKSRKLDSKNLLSFGDEEDY